MLKTLGLSVFLVLSGSAIVQAQVTVDVAKISCEQFVLFKVADPDTIAVWLHGYYSGKEGNTVVDVEALKENVRKLRAHCLQNRDATLLDAVEALRGAQ